jgi:hypothetical protein
MSKKLEFGPTGFVARALGLPPGYNGLLLGGSFGSTKEHRNAAWAEYDARQKPNSRKAATVGTDHAQPV